jgi:hypothetical protein
MKSLLKYSKWLAVAGGATALSYFKQDLVAESLFGRSSSNPDESTPTKTFIWGNGFYQSGGSMSFNNFDPKHIKNFDGKDGPQMR